MRVKLILAFLLVFVSSLVFSSENLNLFNKATQAYDSSNYAEAVRIYESLVQANIVSTDLHFNLANAYFKQNDVPRAILNYEKALKIDPNNEDAEYNLKLANAKTIDKIESIPELFLYRWWKTVFNLFSSELWAIIAVSLLFLAVLASILYFFTQQVSLKKIGFYAATSLLFLALSAWFLAYKQKAYLNSVEQAIIIEPTVNINSSPSAGSSKLFVLHEGTKVKIENQTKDWYEISLPNGNKGWIESEYLEGI